MSLMGPADQRHHRRQRKQDRDQVVEGVREIAAAERDTEHEQTCRAKQGGGHSDQHPALGRACSLHSERAYPESCRDTG